MRALALLIACPLILAIGGCNRRSPVAEQANDTANLIAVVDQANTMANAARAANGKALPPGSAPAAVEASPTGAPPATTPGRPVIPAALQGRWGLTPADCTTPLGDAKGLLVVGSDGLRFYESRAVPGGNTAATPTSYSADFRFTGEGQAWVQFETLQLKNDKLVRTQSNPMTSFTYARCK
jgi:hypothetical protein